MCLHVGLRHCLWFKEIKPDKVLKFNQGTCVRVIKSAAYWLKTETYARGLERKRSQQLSILSMSWAARFAARVQRFRPTLL